jgi:hypothetical protein
MVYVSPRLVEYLSKLMYKKVSKNQESDKQSKRYLKKIKQDDKLREKLDKYSAAETLLMLVLWIAFVIILFRCWVTLPAIENNIINIVTISSSILGFIVFITSMGFFAYVSAFIIREIYKIINPELDSSILKYYSFKMLDKRFTYSAASMGLNPVPVERLLMKWTTIIFIIAMVTFILLIPLLF